MKTYQCAGDGMCVDPRCPRHSPPEMLKVSGVAPEKFIDAGDCPVESVEIETGEERYARKHAGKLWLGAEWITVTQARALRDWLNEAIP